VKFLRVLKNYMIVFMKMRIRLGAFCALCAIARAAAFGSAAADAALSDFGDTRWLYLDHEKSGCLSAIAWY